MKRLLIFISLLTGSSQQLFAQNNIPNPGFEDWDSSSVVNPLWYEPKEWSTLNRYFVDTNRVYAFRSINSHSGNYSLLVTPAIDSTLSAFNVKSVVFSGKDTSFPLKPRDDISFMKTFRFTGKPKKIKGWYKYLPDNSPGSRVSLYLDGITYFISPIVYSVGYAGIESLQASNFFQYFEFPYIETIPGLVADSGYIQVSFFSKNHSLNPQGKFWLDDLEIEYENATVVADQKKTEMKVYPNPVSNEVSFYSQNGAIVELTLLDATGREVYKAYPGVAKIQVDMIAFPSGVYHALVKYGNQIEVMKVVKF